ncbi:glycosyltransferase [Caloramator sp. ALD01]|uniref:glycosyltransferase n=1 Tax=Caloramator sp. ALD01 TaxID=1031288 RepID=UPI000403508D|nr:glycosyltransferase [Caloramator sp. ALD01]
MKLSLCMIVYNEEKYLKMCLDNALPLVDEAVIVDTGSTDKTIEIIKSYGDKVKLIKTKWENDFSKARNLAIENASGDWIFTLDADEKIIATGELKKYIESCEFDGIIVPFYHVVGEGDLVFSNVYIKIFRKMYRYEGAIHEQLNISNNKLVEIPETVAKIYHFGYMKEVFVEKGKINRNLDILLEELRENPDDPFTMYNIGVTYYAKNDFKVALKYFFEATKRMNNIYKNDTTRYEIDMYIKIASCLYRIQEYDECINFIKYILETVCELPDLYYILGETYEAKNDFKNAELSYKKCIDIGENRNYISVKGVGSFYPKFRLAQIYEKQDRILDAAMMYIEGVFDKNNILGKGVIETKEFLKRYNLLNILDEFEKIYKS